MRHIQHSRHGSVAATSASPSRSAGRATRSHRPAPTSPRGAVVSESAGISPVIGKS